MSTARDGTVKMMQRRTVQGAVDVIVMGERREVLIPLVPAWSRHAHQLAARGEPD